MEITNEIMQSSVEGRPFGLFEPFVRGDEFEVEAFYAEVFAALGKLPGVGVHRESDHHGCGYASYVSALLYPSDGRSRRDLLHCVQTVGIRLYLSRLAPIAAYGAGARAENKRGGGSSEGFLTISNVGKLPEGDWSAFLAAVTDCLRSFRIEILPREPLLRPAPEGVTVVSAFGGPYHVFDTLFHWDD